MATLKINGESRDFEAPDDMPLLWVLRDVLGMTGTKVLGGKVARVDDRAAKTIPGVQKVVVLDDLVVVIGDHMWAAKQGLDALVIEWDDGPNADVSTSDIWNDLRAASKQDGVVAKSVCRSARSIRPTLRPTVRPGSAITATKAFSMPCAAASAATGRGSIRPCPTSLTAS
jgi:hypothetical protein